MPRDRHWFCRITTRLRFVTFPRDDAEFARIVNETATRLDGIGTMSAEQLSELMAELRRAYPSIEIRQQDDLASFESVPMTWYVYRDGISSH